MRSGERRFREVQYGVGIGYDVSVWKGTAPEQKRKNENDYEVMISK